MKYTSSPAESKLKLVARWQLLLVCAFLMSGCASSDSRKSDDDEPMQLGWMDRETLFSPAYQPFSSRFDSVGVASKFVELIRILEPDNEVVVFLGTWLATPEGKLPIFSRSWM